MSEVRKTLQLDDDGTSNKLTMVTRSRKKKIKDLNDIIICSICNGYLIEATTISDCLHACKYFIIYIFERKLKTYIKFRFIELLNFMVFGAVYYRL